MQVLVVGLAVARLAPVCQTQPLDLRATMPVWALGDDGRFVDWSERDYWIEESDLQPFLDTTFAPRGVFWTRLGEERRLVEME